VLAALHRHAFDAAVINLMVMDYGDARASRCALRKVGSEVRCDMGRSAILAAANLQSRHGVPPERIEVTAMLGVNDVVLNVFTLEDAAGLAQGVREQGLAGLHWWSLDRDTPCAEPAPAAASDRCSGLPQAPLAFGRALAAAAR
jgi:hypothetical protein